MDTTATEDITYENILEDPTIIRTWDNEELLQRFLDVRFVIMTETRLTSSIDRVAHAIQVGRIEHQEILRRMAEGYISA